MNGQKKQKAAKVAKGCDEVMTKAVHDTEFAWMSLREAHAKAGCVAQIELLSLIGEQAKIMQRTKHLFGMMQLDQEAGES